MLFCIPLLYCMVICVTASTSLALLIWPLGCSLDVFCFFLRQPLETIVCGNPKSSAVSEILKTPCLAPAIIPRSKSLRSHFFPVLNLALNNSWTSWPCLHAFMHFVAAMLHDWLIQYLHLQAGIEFSLIYCALSVYIEPRMRWLFTKIVTCINLLLTGETASQSQ